jgi:hypothetical protein
MSEERQDRPDAGLGPEHTADQKRPHTDGIPTTRIKARRPYPRWQRRHEAILRLILEYPLLSRTEIAAATGYSPTHISRIVNSPDFRERYERAVEYKHQEISRRAIERTSRALTRG